MTNSAYGLRLKYVKKVYQDKNPINTAEMTITEPFKRIKNKQKPLISKKLFLVITAMFCTRNNRCFIIQPKNVYPIVQISRLCLQQAVFTLNKLG